MFYSQFILAKKGPLGTIWIAAHLERKLRKNQVADTDIGVSVDSILFPEVPIALRLSSHLLLGVVRIYSRKVNYLFDDCSEALLKIKQAFRSTAVDLPPEESTAPYHSITLPETFDLDDFELPDSDILQGNYVDHHVSTREQITLQDTMDGVVYSTTQFGLDERFGDGDTSGLDLDEEIFLNKVTAPGRDGITQASDAETHASVQGMIQLDLDNNHQGNNGNSEVMVATGGLNQCDGIAGNNAGNTDFVEYAQAPCTPGLVEEPNLSKTQEASACDDQLELGEEPNLSNIQETLACDDNLESDDHNMTDFPTIENMMNMTSNSDLHHTNENAMSCSLMNDMNPSTLLEGQEINQLESRRDSPSTTTAGDPLLGKPVNSFCSVSEFPDRNFTSFDGVNGLQVLGAQEINQPKSSEDSPSIARDPCLADPVNSICSGSEFPDRNFTSFDGVNALQVLQNEVYSNGKPGIDSIDGAHADSVGLQGGGLDEAVSSPTFSHEVRVLEDPFDCFWSKIENSKSCVSTPCQPVPESVDPDVSNNVENAGNTEKSCPPTNSLASNIESLARQDFQSPEKFEVCQDPKDSKNLNPIFDDMLAATDMHVLRPCTHLNQLSNLNPGYELSVAPHLLSGVPGICSTETSGRDEVLHGPGTSTEVQGEGFHATDFVKQVVEENKSTERALSADIHADINKLNDQVHNVISRNIRLENIDGSENSELPALEKLLSVREGLAYLEGNLLVESTPDKAHSMSVDGGDAGINIISGKKRSFTESTLTVQSLNSIESLGSKRVKESVPDDNDLLSSILGGRRSSVLKMKSTPTPPSEITRMKRPRSATRFCASKRRVLVDDAMVLHGDVIRQQLTTSEDIRRIRKKAPCTRPEIWMIQKEFLEDEIFSEPIFTGLSRGLSLLHSQTYDLSKIMASQNVAHNPFLESTVHLNFSLEKDETNPFEAANDLEVSMELNVNREIGMVGINESIVYRNDVEARPPENQQAEDHVLKSQDYATQMQMEAIHVIQEPLNSPQEHFHYATQMQMEAIHVIQEPLNSPQEHFTEIAEIDSNGASALVVDAVSSATDLGVVAASSEEFGLGNTNKMPADSIVPSTLLDKESAGDCSVQMDATGVPPDQNLDAQSVEMEASVVHISSGKGVGAIKIAEESDDSAAVGGTESRARDELLLDGTEIGASVEIGFDMNAASFAYSRDGNPSLAISPDTSKLSDQVVVAIDQAKEEFSQNELRVLNEDGVLAAEFDNGGKNQTSYGSTKEPELVDAYPVEPDVCLKNASSNDDVYPGSQESDLPCAMDSEIAVTDHTDFVDHGGFLMQMMMTLLKKMKIPCQMWSIPASLRTVDGLPAPERLPSTLRSCLRRKQSMGGRFFLWTTSWLVKLARRRQGCFLKLWCLKQEITSMWSRGLPLITSA
ncbi:hypothetical protein U1Q18_026466 [Sarracenia purpurea var. burkii]